MTIKSIFPFIKSKASKGDLLKEVVTRQQVVNMMAWAAELPNPDPQLRAMGNYQTVYGNMMADPHLSGVIQQRKSGTLKLELKTDKDRADDKIVEFVNENLRYLDTHKITNEFLNAPYYGMTVSEVIWEYTDGKYWIQDIVAKPLDRFFFDYNNNLRYRTNDNKNEIVPPYKFILSQHNASYDRPHGEVLLSKCFWPWTFKKGGLKFALIFMEKYGMPFIIGKQPRGSGKEKADELLNNLTSMIQDAAAVIPDDSSIEILANTSKADGSAYKFMVEFSNTEMSKAILSQTLTTEVQDKGTFATGKVHEGILDYVLMSDKHLVENAWNQAFSWLTFLNFGDVEFPRADLYEEEGINLIAAQRDEILAKLPGFKFKPVYFQRKNYNLAEDEFELTEAVQPEETKNTEEVLQSLNLNGTQIASATKIIEQVSSGDIPRDSGINQLQIFLGLTKAQAEAAMGAAGTGKVIKADKVVNKTKSAVPPAFAEPDVIPAKAGIGLAQAVKNQQAIDQLVDYLSDWQLTNQSKAIIQPILDLLDKSDNVNDVADKLIQLYPEMDVKELEALLEKAMFISEVYGRLTKKETL